MNKKSIIQLSLLVVISLVLMPVVGLRTNTAAAAADEWYGTWQMGPELAGPLIGCGEFDGYARLTGVYYQPDNAIYFLGARCETDTITTGAVFYFDLDTRTYSLTGVSMPIPVSNYQVVTVPDDGMGNGPGFYIIGGRTANASQTSAVQVYYPEMNTTANITSDPFPPTGDPRSPGGVVYAGGKIYVLGGFDGSVMFAETYTYDPAALAGDRWVDIQQDLPTPRSYISVLAVGDLIYAMGGDEFASGSLIPINDTLVLDLNDLASGWQDILMPDLPVENSDAPAVYIPDGLLGGAAGGIFVIGGNFDGPFRWVYRYDLASGVWESFPELVIPDPATGRRNMAAVYVPGEELASTKGLGDGSSGIWVFGGFDGSGANAMTGSSEFFSYTESPILLLPDAVELVDIPGGTVVHTFNLVNLSGASNSFNLSYISDVTWSTSMPASIGPVDDGAALPFDMVVTIPSDVTCPTTGSFTVTATAQSDPLISDTQTVRVVASCGVAGVVTDATSGEPIENAYVFIQNTIDGLDFYADAYTDATGEYLITNLETGTFYMGASADKHQPTIYPDGWPEGAVIVEITGEGALVDFSLVSSLMDWSPGSFDVTVAPGGAVERTLTLNNTGTGPLFYFLNIVDAAQPEPPLAISEMPVPGLPRIDPLLLSNLESSADGKADFVVVLQSQADLRGAQNITDWEACGEYVYNALRGHAEYSQQGVRRMLQVNGVSYHPLNIINAVIVHGGDLALVNSLAARSDVAQIIANRAIEIEAAIEAPTPPPSPIEWNITMVDAPSVWSEYGVTGEGIVVSEIDTGTQWDHPALINQYRGWNGTSADHNYNWFDPYGQSPDAPADTQGHGTHVMGTMVGDDGGENQVGMAPGAQWISCKGGDDVSGYLLTDELLLCADWILAPTDLQGDNPDPSMRPHVVNNSWGGGQNDYWFTGVVDSWRAAGIFPMFSNGNAGPACSTAGSPGDNWNVFSAGASDADDLIAAFSSRGPAALTGYLKPDITAPGADVRSSLPGDLYGSYSGTSMASPHVAGAIALLWSSNPELVGQIELSQWVLQQSAVPKTTDEGCGGDLPTAVPNNTWGWGRLDIYAAVTLARTGGVTPDWLSAAPLAGEVAPGGSTNVTLTFTPSLDMLGDYTATLWIVADDPFNSDVRLPITMTVGEVPYVYTYFPLMFKTPNR